MFEIKNVTKVFGGETALSRVSFEIKGGMNFIIGASGSGKTTLLRILSGMDKNYEGDVFYNGKSVKALSDKEKTRYYGSEFGFISQNFNLIEELSVKENIMLPCYLNDENNKKQLHTILKKLKIESLADQKSNTLSGGQKQRVAIARELMKNPRVLIADEPTAALDTKTAKEICDIIYEISRETTVIIVTHDTSLIRDSSSVLELDKGVLVKNDMKEVKQKPKKTDHKNLSLTTAKAIQITKINFKRNLTKMISMIVAMVIAVSCLVINLVGLLSVSSSNAFNELIEKQGNYVLNLNIVSSFMSASLGDNAGKEQQSVEQDINGLIEKYQDDDRVSAITMLSPINDAVVNVDGIDFIIESSGQSPVFNSIIAGENADNNENEVVLPKIMVEKMGHTNESILGKELEFIGSVFNWESGKPVKKGVAFKAVVSGVADTSYVVDIIGEHTTFEHDDALFFSLSIMKEMYAQAEIKNPNFAITIRANSPEDFVFLYDEIMANGIVPLGQIELIRDIVSLKSDTDTQTNVSYTVIAILSLVVVLSACLVLSYMRKKEYAVYKLNGYSKGNLAKIIAFEYLELAIISGVISTIICLILGAPVFVGIVITVCVYVLCGAINGLISISTNELLALKTGGR